jgi:DNA-nicking Smr family endonuclease
MARKPHGGDETPGLSDEDRDLWRHVTQEAEPLKKPARKPRDTGAAPGEAPSRAAKPERTVPRRHAPPPRAAPKPPPDLGHGDIVGVDRRTAERLKRGLLPIEATLDLHGHRQAEAHRDLDAFLARAQASGRRCVLVVTGKGVSKEEGGVLRAQVPRWLNEPPNRARVLAFAYAQPKHGGHGALYVLLRRQRTPS